MYLLDVDTGLLLGNEVGDHVPDDLERIRIGLRLRDHRRRAGNGRKNAMQADPTAAGASGSVAVSKAYLGDIDGKLLALQLHPDGSISREPDGRHRQPIYASSALLFVGSADVYMFFATGQRFPRRPRSGRTGTFKLYGLKDNGPGSGNDQVCRRSGDGEQF